ncbi:MAG: hypothetical protein R3Y58_13015 [Eubacteriales bacterium]
MKKILQILLLLTITCAIAGANSTEIYASSYEAQVTSASSLEEIAANGLYVSEDNVLYITDLVTNQIYQYNGSKVTLIAGNANVIIGESIGGYIDGYAEYALFDEPFMAVPWEGGVIVSDSQNNMLRYIEDGIVTTYAGSQAGGYQDGTAADSLFENPSGLALDDQGNLYIADTGNGAIRKIDANGLVTTYVDGLNGPKGLCWYDGSLYATDIETNEILMITSGVTTVIAGSATQIEDEWISGYVDGAIEDATFSLPQGIYVDETGIYIGDTGNNVIRTIIDGVVYTSYAETTIGEPVGIVMYNGELLVGDPFAQSTTQTGVTTANITNITTNSATDDKDSDLEIEEVGMLAVGSTTSNIWGILGAVIVFVLAAVAIIIVVATKMNNKTNAKTNHKTNKKS